MTLSALMRHCGLTARDFGRDHTTILHGLRRTEAGPDLKARAEAVRGEIGGAEWHSAS